MISRVPFQPLLFCDSVLFVQPVHYPCLFVILSQFTDRFVCEGFEAFVTMYLRFIDHVYNVNVKYYPSAFTKVSNISTILLWGCLIEGIDYARSGIVIAIENFCFEPG